MQQPLPMTIDPVASRPQAAPPAPARRRARDWHIDARTRRVGLRGVARARAALEASRPAASRSDAA